MTSFIAVILVLLTAACFILYNMYKEQKSKSNELSKRPKKIDYNSVLAPLTTSDEFSKALFSLQRMKKELELSWDEAYAVLGQMTYFGLIHRVTILECNHCEHRHEIDKKAESIKTCKLCYKELINNDEYRYTYFKLDPLASEAVKAHVENKKVSDEAQ